MDYSEKRNWGGARLITASSVPSLYTTSGWDLRKNYHKKEKVLVTANKFKNLPFIDLSNLKSCSETYQISDDIKDYVINEVPANNVGIPNRNLDAFEYCDVTEWRPELGRIAYKTYRWKACLVGSTLVDTDKGLIPLKDLKEKGIEQIRTRKGYRRLLNWWDNGIKDVIELKLDTGNFIIGTEDHRILRLNEKLQLEWSEIKNLNPGSYIATVPCVTTNDRPNLIFHRVKEKIAKGTDMVYDIEVEEEHEYIANGVVVHNCNINHDNKDPKKAKGVIFDSYMQKIKGHWHVIVIAGWDRTKDPQLANRIAKGKDAGYSMACLVGKARCSVCDFASNGGHVSCKHVKNGAGKGQVWQPTNQLVYEKCGNLNYYELSHVEDKADWDCITRWVV